MKIIKKYQGTVPSNKILGTKTNSNTDTYNCNYINLSAYPVGSIYMSVNATSPAELFGGSWEQWGNGRVLTGVDTSQTEFNTVEKIGGEKTHTLSVNEMPSHNHRGYPYVSGSGQLALNGSSGGGNNFVAPIQWVTNNASQYLCIYAEGGSQAHNNLQPYITCYMWKRIG